MTDKELRKLSRLELLELLLKEGRENEKLKAELDKLRSENSIEKSTQQLMVTVEKLNESLHNTDNLASLLQNLISHENPVLPENNSDTGDSAQVKEKTLSADACIYKQLMLFFARNTEYLSCLPEDLRKDVINRLKELLVKK